ncbi:alpha-hydroxy acid oxidase [Pseudonocardia dioxanivorans]|uniref:alpha-hydroxy acid oxidase n=1 Tax=Pseudonocardia dioxanivorans TaxID=240495 RepID=UPI000CD162F5|nr:alpha-hydroxy acid oxidase [Pseudonocardia dioxanivorans]
MRSGRLAHVHNVEDMRRLARRRLPRAVFDIVDGGAGDEVTLRRNRESLDRIALKPRALADVAKVDTSTTILGDPVSVPFMLAPCSSARMCHSASEPAVARAAGRLGTAFAVAGGASEKPEVIARAATGPLWYQLYMKPEQQANVELVDRVEAAGYRVLCVTVDSAIKPYREKDLRNRVGIPLKISPQLVLAGASRPFWARDYLLGQSGGGLGRIAARAARVNPLAKGTSARSAPAEPAVEPAGPALDVMAAKRAYDNLADAISHVKSVTVDDIRWLRERWAGPLVVKGILRGDEVPQLVDLGVDGIVVSNHGGRNMDGAPATIDVLGEVVDAAAGRAEVFLDSGVRRGADVVRALALGAQAVLVGRPYMFALAAAGEAGVDRVLELLRNEVVRVMSQLGAATVDEIDASLVDLGR